MNRINDAQDIYKIHHVKKSESFNSITILVTPWEKGFKCGIITTDDMFEMTDEQYELCTTIAKVCVMRLIKIQIKFSS